MIGIPSSFNGNYSNYNVKEKQQKWHTNRKKKPNSIGWKLTDCSTGRKSGLHIEYAGYVRKKVLLMYQKHVTNILASWLRSGIAVEFSERGGGM